MATDTNTSMQRSRNELAPTEATRPGRVITPPVDIFETTQSIMVMADMPGVAADELTIDLTEGVLTITGHADEPESSGEAVLSREYGAGTYQRKFTLSQSIDQEKIQAKLVHGVLHLELPKVGRAQPRKIAVASS